MGCSDMTDGVKYIWPEGLLHYIVSHSVRLPSEFITEMVRLQTEHSRLVACGEVDEFDGRVKQWVEGEGLVEIGRGDEEWLREYSTLYDDVPKR